MRIQLLQSLEVPDADLNAPIPKATLQHPRHRLRTRPCQRRRHRRQRHRSFVRHHSQALQRRHRRGRSTGEVRLLTANLIRSPSGGQLTKSLRNHHCTQQWCHPDAPGKDTGTDQDPHPPDSRQSVRRSQQERRNHHRRQPTLQSNVPCPAEELPLRCLRPSRHHPDQGSHDQADPVHRHPASSRPPTDRHPSHDRQQRHRKVSPRVHTWFDRPRAWSFRELRSSTKNGSFPLLEPSQHSASLGPCVPDPSRASSSSLP